MTYVLAGDVGGTKTVLCLYAVSNDTSNNAVVQEVHKATYPSSGYAFFSELIVSFLAEVAPHRPLTACLGIAGPVQDQKVETTNLPWTIDAIKLADEFGFKDIYLLNDLEAAAHGMLHLSNDELIELNPNAISRPGHLAVISAGTGLGEAILAWDGKRYTAIPSEGGHCDFAPLSVQEDALLVFLRERFAGHVSYERILAGNGFSNLYDFLSASGYAKPDPNIEARLSEGDRNAQISRLGLAGEDPICAEALRLFVLIYGREAGNLALKCLPRSGIYIGGGIAPKIKSAFQNGEFMQAFLDKGRMSHAIKDIPVRLSLNPEAPLIGAAHIASQKLD